MKNRMKVKCAVYNSYCHHLMGLATHDLLKVDGTYKRAWGGGFHSCNQVAEARRPPQVQCQPGPQTDKYNTHTGRGREGR